MTTPPLPDHQPQRDADLFDAFEQVVQLLVSAGLSVTVPEPELDPDDPLTDFARWLCVEPDTTGGATTWVCVVTAPWTQALSLRFTNRFVRILLNDPGRGPATTSATASTASQAEAPSGAQARFRIYSAYPVSPMVDYIFGNWPAGRLEADSLLVLGGGTPVPEQCPALAQRACSLLKAHFGVELDLDALGSIEALNRLVLEELRPCDDPGLALKAGVYQPGGLLVMLGAALGETIRRAHPTRVRWTEDADATSDSDFPILEIRPSHAPPVPDPNDPASSDGEGAVDYEESFIFPFDKMFQFYQNGIDRNLNTYYNVVIANILSDEPSDEHPASGTFEEASGELIPVLKPAHWNEDYAIVGVPLMDNGPMGTPVVTVAIDHPRQIAFIVESKLEGWGVDLPTVVGRACANLARVSRDMESRLESLALDDLNVHRLDYGDYFNASRIMLADQLHAAAQAVIDPDATIFAVAVPSRDHLLIASVPEREDMLAFRSLVLWFHERQPAPVSSVCFLLGAEGLVGYYGVEPNA